MEGKKKGSNQFCSGRTREARDRTLPSATCSRGFWSGPVPSSQLLPYLLNTVQVTEDSFCTYLHPASKGLYKPVTWVFSPKDRPCQQCDPTGLRGGLDKLWAHHMWAAVSTYTHRRLLAGQSQGGVGRAGSGKAWELGIISSCSFYGGQKLL